MTADLDRFGIAQDAQWDAIRAELRAGRKTSHWMWYVFPQLAELGRSERAKYYGISGRAEAEAYLAHPLLGSRLRACARLVLDADAATPEDIFGPVDAMKLRSSMTLFDAVEPDAIWADVLARYYDGQPDLATLDLLERG